jgi:hypothetical protein
LSARGLVLKCPAFPVYQNKTKAPGVISWVPLS